VTVPIEYHPFCSLKNCYHWGTNYVIQARGRTYPFCTKKHAKKWLKRNIDLIIIKEKR
jgi:YHS domain-containing protein